MVRPGVGRRRGRDGGSSVPAWLAFGPSHSWRFDSLVSTIAGEVQSVGDMLAPLDPSRAMTAAAPGERPALIASSAPSGVPAMLGAVGKALRASLVAGMGAGPVTAYVASVLGNNGGGGTSFGEGSSVSGARGRIRQQSTTTQSQLSTGAASAGSLGAAGVPFWHEYAYDGVTLEAANPIGFASAAVAPAGTDVIAMGARIAAGSTIQEDTNGEVSWALTYPRVLAPAERSAVRATLAAWLGI